MGEPGWVQVVVRGDRLETTYDGHAVIEHEVPITPATRFYVASVMKPFTTLALGLLADRQGLDLDSEARSHVPWLSPAFTGVTLRHLITHRSGLRDPWAPLLAVGVRYNDGIEHADVDDFLARCEALCVPPGERELYCNSGFVVLAHVIAAVTGDTYREFVEKEIFAPLGMRESSIRDEPAEPFEQASRCYLRQPDGGYLQADPFWSTVGSTGLVTTAGDLARFLQALHNPPAELAAAVRPMVADPSLGFAQRDVRGDRVLMHTGSDGGGRAVIGFLPEGDFAVVLLSNAAHLGLNDRFAALVYDELGIAEKPGPQGEHGSTPEPDDLPTQITPSLPVRDYLGSYRCEELDCTLTVVADGEGLRLERRRTGGVGLLESTPDAFATAGVTLAHVRRAFSELRFTRDGDGRVVGFRLRELPSPHPTARWLTFDRTG